MTISNPNKYLSPCIKMSLFFNTKSPTDQLLPRAHYNSNHYRDFVMDAETLSLFNTGIAANTATIAQHTQSLSNHTVRIDALESGETSVDTRLTAAEGNIASLEGSVASIDSAIEQLDTEVAANGIDIAATNTALNTLTGRVTTAEGDIDAVQAQQITDQTTFSGAITAANANIATNSNSITTTNGNVTALTTRVTTAEGNIATNTTNITSNTTSIGTTNGNVTALTTRVTTAEGNITSNTSNISNLNTQIGNTNFSVGQITPTTKATFIAGNGSAPALVGAPTVDGYALVADSTQSTGMKWASVAPTGGATLDGGGKLVQTQVPDIFYKNVFSPTFALRTSSTVRGTANFPYNGVQTAGTGTTTIHSWAVPTGNAGMFTCTYKVAAFNTTGNYWYGESGSVYCYRDATGTLTFGQLSSSSSFKSNVSNTLTVSASVSGDNLLIRTTPSGATSAWTAFASLEALGFMAATGTSVPGY
jgi:uncharacterized coiled-coil protein SlyX